MPHEDVELAGRANDAFARGDLEAWAALHDPDCAFLPLGCGALLVRSVTASVGLKASTRDGVH
jgi:hypothetical protein